MRTHRLLFGTGLVILLGSPAWAQVDTTTATPATAQEQIPALPSLQDVRSPLTTITNRPRATTGAASGPGQTAIAPGARTPFPGTDLQQRIGELGRSLGPPWRQDEKLASLAAWIALAESK